MDGDYFALRTHHLYSLGLRVTGAVILLSAVAGVNIAHQCSELNPNKAIKYTN